MDGDKASPFALSGGSYNMPKRHIEHDLLISPRPKRMRLNDADNLTDHLSSLSNEILLHILSFLPIPALLTCHRSVILQIY